MATYSQVPENDEFFSPAQAKADNISPVNIAHKRRLLIGGAGVVKGRVANSGRLMVSICDEIEPILESSGWFPAAPFQTVSLITRPSQ